MGTMIGSIFFDGKEKFFVAGFNAWCPDRYTIGHIAQLEVFPNYRIYRLESFVSYVIAFFGKIIL